jgi:carbon storage regulator
MLVLSRREGERIVIGPDIVVEVVECSRGKRVRLGISAPQEVAIYREELAVRMNERRQGMLGPLNPTNPSIVVEGCSR